MNKLRKIAFIIAAVFILAASPVFTLDFNIDGLNNALDGFMDELAGSLPFNATVGLNWSDAYIGPLFNLPPHFGLGVTAGVTPLNFKAIDSLLGVIGMEGSISGITDQMGKTGKIFDIMGGFPLPAYTFDFRLGGFGIPFDIGFKLGLLNTANINILKELLPDIGLNYMLIGGDFRYALIDGKKFPLKLSIGIGYSHMSTKIAFEAPMDPIVQKIEGPVDYYFRMETPGLDLNWNTNIIEAKAQVSFPLLIITPYAGVGAGYGWSKAGYGVGAPVGVYNNTLGDGHNYMNEYKNELENLGYNNLTDLGFSNISEPKGSFNLRAFGGLSFNIFVIKIDLNVMYNFLSKGLGATVGLRFQL